MYPEPAVFRVIAKDPVLYVNVVFVVKAYDQSELNKKIIEIKEMRPSLIISDVERVS